MAEPREVQRLDRMMQNANKFMDRIAAHPEHEKVPRWTECLKELVLGIEVAEHEAAAAKVKQKQKTGGVDIQVPAHHFVRQSDEPVVAE